MMRKTSSHTLEDLWFCLRQKRYARLIICDFDPGDSPSEFFILSQILQSQNLENRDQDFKIHRIYDRKLFLGSLNDNKRNIFWISGFSEISRGYFFSAIGIWPIRYYIIYIYPIKASGNFFKSVSEIPSIWSEACSVAAQHQFFIYSRKILRKNLYLGLFSAHIWKFNATWKNVHFEFCFKRRNFVYLVCASQTGSNLSPAALLSKHRKFFDTFDERNNSRNLRYGNQHQKWRIWRKDSNYKAWTPTLSGF